MERTINSSLVKKATISVERVVHRGSEQFALRFPYNEFAKNHLKALPGVRWSRTMRCFYLKSSAENKKRLIDHCRGVLTIANNAIVQKTEANAGPVEHQIRIDRFENWLRSKRYSNNTIKTYSDALRTFLSFHKGKQPESITNEDVVKFNNEYIIAKGYSFSYQNQVVNALKLFCKQIEGNRLDPELIHRPRSQQRLPHVLSKEEVKEILEITANIKHRVMLGLIYGCGLRRSELLGLKLTDVNSKRGILRISQGKGYKDRIVPLPERILGLLRDYYKAYRPEYWLFEGQKSGKQYSATSLQKVLKNACRKAGIKKPVTLHWLRHSYATHLLESGTDIRYIQKLLGHKSSRTTELYTHVSTHKLQNLKSPFDDL